MHDLVIDNARIIDGLDAPKRAGGVAVTGGQISAIGTDLGAGQAAGGRAGAGGGPGHRGPR